MPAISSKVFQLVDHLDSNTSSTSNCNCQQQILLEQDILLVLLIWETSLSYLILYRRFTGMRLTWICYTPPLIQGIFPSQLGSLSKGRTYINIGIYMVFHLRFQQFTTPACLPGQIHIEACGITILYPTCSRFGNTRCNT